MEPALERFMKVLPGLKWTFATTYAKDWPHDYVVRSKTLAEDDFATVLAAIGQLGKDEEFYTAKTRYLRHDGLLYWVTADGDPAGDPTAVVNRTFEQLSYQDRKSSGNLPGQKRWEELRPKFVAVDEQVRVGWKRTP